MSLALIALQFRYTHHVLKQNLDGFTEDEGLRTPEAGGNGANWILGHLLNSRAELLEVLGRPEPWHVDRLAAYKRGTHGLGADEAIALPNLLADLDTTQESLLAGFKAFDLARLGDPAPWSPTENPKETLGSLFAGLAFHEAYHTGQTGLLRRMVGKQGTIK